MTNDPGRKPHIGTMSPEEHRQRHIELHGWLDELVADWLLQCRGAMPSSSTVMELMNWSKSQTLEPTTIKGAKP